MSGNSSTSLLSFTNSENGGNDSVNQDTNVCDTSKPPSPHPVGGSKGDHPCNPIQKTSSSYAKAMKFIVGCSHQSSNSPTALRANPALLSSVPLANHEIGNPSSPDLRAHELPFFGPPSSPPTEHMDELTALCLVVKIVLETFGGADVKALVNVSNPSLPKEPMTTANQWIRHLNVPPTHTLAQSQDKASNSIGTSHEPPPNDLILAHPKEVPANVNVNDYEDSQDIILHEEEMADTFLNLDHIQDVDMRNLGPLEQHHAPVLAKENHAIYMLVHDLGKSKNILTKYQEIDHMVSKNWEISVKGSKMF
ncbi:hypothetical protein Cgig2_029720 [Carnegiea gigantea]|uniref:Uncharacterized protein n=1 Tax=Carnegiea gigantea TaxID=171969 RepID=A0A9Q1QEI5_9CARY|nr:hypothetical protein Cgig2_029720 [Carnegiea gigantea]